MHLLDIFVRGVGICAILLTLLAVVSALQDRRLARRRVERRL